MMPSSVSMQPVFNKMTRLKFALYVTCLLIGGLGAVTLEPSSSLQIRTVCIGENVTLECFYQESMAVEIYWFKEILGQKPERMSVIYKYEEKGTLVGEYEKDPRLKLDISPGKYHLNITDVQTSDSATYHCMSSLSRGFDFIGGVILHVTNLAFNVPAIIHQSESEVVQHGASVTLSCTVLTGSCDGDLRVYWVKNPQEDHPGLIYTHGGMNKDCEREVNSKTHTCVYSLEMEKLSGSHAGTYHCAVASCGHVLLGNGTKLEIKDEDDDEEEDVLVYVLSAALAFMTILAVFQAYKAFTKKETTSCISTGPGERASAVSGPNTEGDQIPEILHYSASRWNDVNPSARQRDNTWSECVYSGIRHRNRI